MVYSGAPVLRAGSCWGCVWRAALGLPQTVVNVVERGCNAAVAVNQVVEVAKLIRQGSLHVPEEQKVLREGELSEVEKESTSTHSGEDSPTGPQFPQPNTGVHDFGRNPPG